jgi:hypothetical protein
VADRVDQPRHTEAGRARIDEKAGHAALVPRGGLGVGQREHHRMVGIRRIRDPLLRAVQHPMVAVAHCARLHRKDVRARIGFAQPEAQRLLAARDRVAVAREHGRIEVPQHRRESVRERRRQHDGLDQRPAGPEAVVQRLLDMRHRQRTEARSADRLGAEQVVVAEFGRAHADAAAQRQHRSDVAAVGLEQRPLAREQGAMLVLERQHLALDEADDRFGDRARVGVDLEVHRQALRRV